LKSFLGLVSVCLCLGLPISLVGTFSDLFVPLLGFGVVGALQVSQEQHERN
jgi:hypothetical protein